MKTIQTLASWLGVTLFATVLAALAPEARADAITDWNVKTGEIIAEARIGTPPAMRVMAFVQTAAHHAVTAVAPQSPQAAPTLDAAIAAAHRAVLLKLLPAQQASIDAAYQAALAPLAVLKAELGASPTPLLSTSSPTLKGATRRWTRFEDFVQEVSEARIHGGIHFRAATQAGEAMGRRIGELAASRLHGLPH